MKLLSRKVKAPRTRIRKITYENDIRYLGPIHYQHFQILGWLCIVASQGYLLLELGGKLDRSYQPLFEQWGPWLSRLADLALPLLLLANFAQILNVAGGYRKQILKNAGASAAVAAVALLLYNRYVVNTLAAFGTDPSAARPALDILIHALAPNGFVCFNLFIDLLLCTLVMLFLDYRPRRVFRGRWIYLFRLFTLLPIAYELGCMALKVLSAKGAVALPLWFFPLLPVKPPMTFVLFLILAVFVKVRERRSLRRGKTLEEYRRFLKTRRNSWNFSVFLAIMIVVVSALDLAVMMGYSVFGVAQGISGIVISQYEQQQSVGQTDENQVVIADGTDAEFQADGLQTVPAETSREDADGNAAGEEAALDDESMQALLTLLNELEAQSEAEAESGAEAARPEAPEEEPNLMDALIGRELGTAQALGFGGTISMLALAPVVLLFSYSKLPRRPRASLLIPPIAIILILFLYLEAFLELLWSIPIPKVDLTELSELVALAAASLRLG